MCARKQMLTSSLQEGSLWPSSSESEKRWDAGSKETPLALRPREAPDSPGGCSALSVSASASKEFRNVPKNEWASRSDSGSWSPSIFCTSARIRSTHSSLSLVGLLFVLMTARSSASLTTRRRAVRRWFTSFLHLVAEKEAKREASTLKIWRSFDAERCFTFGCLRRHCRKTESSRRFFQSAEPGPETGLLFLIAFALFLALLIFRLRFFLTAGPEPSGTSWEDWDVAEEEAADGSANSSLRAAASAVGNHLLVSCYDLNEKFGKLGEN